MTVKRCAAAHLSLNFLPPPPLQHNCQQRVVRSATLTARNLWGAHCRRAQSTAYLFTPFFFLNEVRKQYRRLETRHIPSTESGTNIKRHCDTRGRSPNKPFLRTRHGTDRGQRQARVHNPPPHRQTEHVVFNSIPPCLLTPPISPPPSCPSTLHFRTHTPPKNRQLKRDAFCTPNTHNVRNTPAPTADVHSS